MFPIFDSIENNISGYMQLIIIYKHTLFVEKWKYFTHCQVLLEKQCQTQTTAHSDL